MTLGEYRRDNTRSSYARTRTKTKTITLNEMRFVGMFVFHLPFNLYVSDDS